MKKRILIASFILGIAFLSSAQNTVYSIGLNPALGGYVIQLTKDKKHGVVVETKDMCLVTEVTDVWMWVEVYIPSSLMNRPIYHTSDGAKFTDWRLPTKRELDALYFQKNAIGGFTEVGDYCMYWSSQTNANITMSWAQMFSTGFQGERPTTKDFPSHVRLVRDF